MSGITWRRRGIGFATLALVSALFPVTARAADSFGGCSKTLTNRLRSSSIVVNAAPSCKPNETARSWSEVGPPGATGPSDAFVGLDPINDDTPVPASGVLKTLVRIQVPAGKYLASAKGTFLNSNPTNQAIAYCFLVGGGVPAGRVDQARATLPPFTGIVGQATMLSLIGPLDFAVDSIVELQCTNNTFFAADGDLMASDLKLAAIRVGNLTVESFTP
jgi:hypothetical protein